MHINILIWVYTVVFAINFALSVCAHMYSIYLHILELIRELWYTRIYIVFYSALIFVCNAYSYDTRICMIRTFIWYVYSYDSHVRRWYAYSGIQLMICVWYEKKAFPGFKFQKFSGGGMPPYPPTYARSFQMLQSHFWLDLPLNVIWKRTMMCVPVNTPLP